MPRVLLQVAIPMLRTSALRVTVSQIVYSASKDEGRRTRHEVVGGEGSF